MRRLTVSGLAVIGLLTAVVLVEHWHEASAGKPPVIVAGTSWSLSGKSKGNLKGLGKFKDDSTGGTIHFGPLLTPVNLVANTFLFQSQTTLGSPISVGGTYNQDNKGKIVVNSNATDVQNLIATVTIDVAAEEGISLTVNDVDLEKTKQKAKAKEKKGVPEIKVQFQSKSLVNGSAEGESGEAKAKFSFKGSGGQTGGSSEF